MKTLFLLLLTGCTGLTPRQALQDTLSVAAAGGIGYATGGRVGAAVGMTTAELANLRRISRTAAKQPVLVVPGTKHKPKPISNKESRMTKAEIQNLRTSPF